MNQFLSYWQMQSGIFGEQVARIRQRASRSAVHDCRVAVKKMKALLRLAMAASTQNQDFTLSPALQLIFGTAGRYRDTEMSLLLLRTLNRKEGILLPSFLKYQKAIWAINRKNLRLSVSASLEPFLTETSLQLQETEAMDETETNDLIHRLAAVQLAELNGKMKDFTAEAHGFRKKLKRLFYWLEWVSVNTLFDPRQMKTLHKALDALGQWHDHEVLRQRIRLFRKTCLVKGMEEEDACRKAEAFLQLKSEEWLFGAKERIEKLLAA